MDEEGSKWALSERKMVTFPGDISCPRNQPSAPEEPVSFSQVGGRVSLSIGSSRLNSKPSESKHPSGPSERGGAAATAHSPPPGRNAAWNLSQICWISITRPSGNWLRGTFAGCRSFGRSESKLIKPSV